MGTFPGKRDRDASFSLIVELVLVLLFILIYDLVMTAYYQYCRMGEKGGVNFGGSAWQVVSKTDLR
jgi:hypothetical protein